MEPPDQSILVKSLGLCLRLLRGRYGLLLNLLMNSCVSCELPSDEEDNEEDDEEDDDEVFDLDRSSEELPI